MASAIQNQFIQQNFSNLDALIKWMDSNPFSFDASPKRVALAIIVQRAVGPIIRKESEIKMEGNVLPAEISQTKQFRENLKRASVDLKSTALPLLINHSQPLNESNLVVSKKKTVTKVSKVIFLVLHAKQPHDLEVHEKAMCKCIKEKLVGWKKSIGFFATTRMNDEQPSFSSLINLSTLNFLNTEDKVNVIQTVFQKLESTLKPREGLMIWEKNFEHGMEKETETRISFPKKDGILGVQEERHPPQRYTFTTFTKENLILSSEDEEQPR